MLRRTEYPIPGNSNSTRPKTSRREAQGGTQTELSCCGSGLVPALRRSPRHRGRREEALALVILPSLVLARSGTAAHGRGLGRRRARRLDGSGKPRRGCTRPGTAARQLPRAASGPPSLRAQAAPDARVDAFRGGQREQFAGEAGPRAQAMEVSTTVEAGAFQATFKVPGRVTVPQDTSKSSMLAGRPIEPSLLVKVSPAVDETAYLEVSFVNEDEAPLLPGEVGDPPRPHLRRQSAPQGHGDGRHGEHWALGADDRVKVARVPLRRREAEIVLGSGRPKTDVREFKTTVRNLHAQPIRISVIDRLPFSENGAIRVEELRETTRPIERAVTDKRGVMAWTWDYAPGEQKEIRLAYQIRWPGDRELLYEQKPIGPGS